MVGATHHRRLNIRLELDEDAVPHDEGVVRALLVGLGLHDVASAVKMLRDDLLHVLSFL